MKNDCPAADDRINGFAADWLPAIILGVYTIAASITVFFISVFAREELGFSAAQIGVLFSIQAVSGILAAFPAGMGNDRISSRHMLMIGLTMAAIAFFAMSAARAFVFFTMTFFVWSLFNWVFRLSMDVYFLRTDARNAIGRRIAFFQAWRFISMTAGILATGYLIEWMNFANTLFIVGIVCLALTIACRWMPDTPVQRVRLMDYKADFSDRRIVLFAVWMLLFATHWGAEQTCYGLFLRETFHLSYQGMGWYFACEFLAIAVGVLLIRDLIIRRDRFRIIAMLGLLMSGVGHIGMLAQPVYLSALFRILHGFGDGFMLVIQYYGISVLFSLEHIGGNTGMINLVTMIGYIAGALFYSFIGDAYGYGYPFLISGVMVLLLIFPFFWIRPRSQAGTAAS